jgi:hypothetical protein
LAFCAIAETDLTLGHTIVKQAHVQLGVDRSDTRRVGLLAARRCRCELHTKRRIVDAEPSAAEVAGAAWPRGTGAGTSAMSGGAGAFAMLVAAGTGAEADTATGHTRAAAGSGSLEEENYGWVKFVRTPLGYGKTSNAQLRRKLKVTLLGELAVDATGYVMRSSLATSYVDVVLAISNTGAELRCFVEAETVTWKTATGEVVSGDEQQMTYLSGSVADADHHSPTTTCLGPGETGYFLETGSAPPGAKPLFDSLNEVELTLAASASRFVRPKYRVLPISWQGTTDELAVTFENMGTAPAPIELAQGQFVLTDGDGLPLAWGLLEIRTGLTMLGTGQTLLLKADVPYDGKASNMLVTFGY